MLTIYILAILGLLFAYLWRANKAIATTPPEAKNLCQKPWPKAVREEAYRKVQTSPTDVRPFLFSKRNRRYVVTGGSGLVGGWIVHHLMMRGEDPAAIRIVDLSPTRREEAIQANIDFIKTDVSDVDAVNRAFRKPWPDHVKSLPLTVFHCVAYINASDRKPDFTSTYVKVNINGTKNVLKAAQDAEASILVATSSGSIGLRVPSYFTWPWFKWPKNIFQLSPNAEPKSLNGPLEAFTSCYSWSKAQAEMAVHEANSPQEGFLTGAIRPAHAIYGHGVENSSSITWDYLRKGGSPSWIPNVVAQFVNAQNVSIGHLAYENALLNKTHSGGKGYCVMDPNPPITYGFLYKMLETLSNPSHPVHFPYIPFMPMLFLSYILEAYTLFRHRYLPSLPKIQGDIAILQPSTMHMCTLHTIYDDSKAKEELGYRAPIETLEGFAHAVLDWNRKIETSSRGKTEQGKGDKVQIQAVSDVPKAPNVH